MRFPSAVSRALAIAVLASAALVAGCNGQAEGERCDMLAANSGNSDCSGSLVCTSITNIGTHSGVCCPSDRSQATTTICMNNGGGIDASTAPPDASTTGDETTGDETTAGDASPE